MGRQGSEPFMGYAYSGYARPTSAPRAPWSVDHAVIIVAMSERLNGIVLHAAVVVVRGTRYVTVAFALKPCVGR